MKFRNLNLVCPNCYNEIESHEKSIRCTHCNKRYRTLGDKPNFSEVNYFTKDKLDIVKYIFKQYPRVYEFLIDVLSPVYPKHRMLVRRLVNQLPEDSTLLNLGSGNTRLSESIVNIDVIDYANVDIIAEVTNLPFKEQTIDCVVSIAVLEHVENPTEAVSEIARVLKKGGKAYVYVPFMMGFHASPADYNRWTMPGLALLFKNFKIISKVSVGPTSALLWIFQEWIAILLSFNNRKLHDLILILTMSITWPLKYFDFLLSKSKFASNVSAGFLFELEKEKD